jgi:hypothetical protein
VLVEVWEDGVKLLFYYVGLMLLGDLAAYLLGLGVERTWGPVASLWVFLTLYFLFLWVSWIIAVWLSAPRNAPSHAAVTSS